MIWGDLVVLKVTLAVEIELSAAFATSNHDGLKNEASIIFVGQNQQIQLP
jgi:uridine phosphorylase